MSTNGETRRLRFDGARRPRGRQFLNRTIIPSRDMERAIFIPLRTRNSVSALNLASSPNSTNNNLAINNSNADIVRREGNRTGSNRPRINVSSFFMELTYSTGEPNGIPHLLRNSTEGHKRRLEIHAANTMNFIKQYCPAKPHKMNQFRCCARTKRDETFKFQNIANKPLETLDPTQTKCNTKVLVIIRDDSSGKWSNPFTSCIMSSLAKKHLNPTCITFQSETFLNTLVEQLNDDLHVFPKNTNVNDSTFTLQAKRFIVMSTLAKLVENWSVPLIVLDSCLTKLLDLEEVVDFCKRFQIKLIDVDSSVALGNSKQKKAGAKRIQHQIKRALIESNMQKVRGALKRLEEKGMTDETLARNSNLNAIDPTLISEDCRRIVFNLHERMTVSLSLEQQKLSYRDRSSTIQSALATQLSLLEDGILTDIENSDAFKCPRADLHTPNSSQAGKVKSRVESARTTGKENGESRPKTSPHLSDEEPLGHRRVTQAHFSTALVREQEKISELLFNELNQRWRIHGPQRFTPRSDAGPYCNGITDSEKQLLLSILQEVTYFEMLKDIRNELKDSKKDLEGRLYGYNPDFANLIASAEEFLHGKASCMEPCKDEIQFYKLPVSLVFSVEEVKYLRAKPPTYVVGQESPNQLIKVAIEESTKIFTDAVVHTSCGARKLSSSWRNKTKIIVVIEDNNEVLELLAIALWFFEKVPLATFQSKYYYNTAEFLLSLDACRFYFKSYPAHTAKKDEEHIFERWLGVGMNGILRSNQHKILLVDFPHPGTHLQNSKNILLNRLKIEEKQNNIRSLIVGKPSRKEDNLSTVEKLLDEIQIALEPRDKLLFRKSRRMYMDLKLYKQIEQKSRQDLKALRDWGLPEPENEHELWEMLRNSEIVINDTVPLQSQDELLQRPESVALDFESSCCYDEEVTSEQESTVLDDNKSETSKISGDVNFLSECEESLESITVGDDHSSVTDDTQHYFATLQFHANRTSGGFGSFPTSGHQRRETEVNEGFNDQSITVSNQSDVELIENDYAKTKNLSYEEKVHNLETKSIPKTGLRRSAGFLNLLDKCAAAQSIDIENDVKKETRNSKGIKSYDITDSELRTGAFTKLEFTLPPKLTSDECASSSSYASLVISRQESIEKKLKKTKSFSWAMKSKSSDEKLTHCAINKNEQKQLSSKKGFSEVCAAYIGKWGKSLSRALQKKTLRKSFPGHLIPSHRVTRGIKARLSERSSLPLHLESETNRVHDHVFEIPNVRKEVSEGERKSTANVLYEKQSSPRPKQTWLTNIRSHFKMKANNRHETN